jgi:hypothetical protein
MIRLYIPQARDKIILMTEAQLDSRCREVLAEIEIELAKTTDFNAKQRWLDMRTKWRMLLHRNEQPMD